MNRGRHKASKLNKLHLRMTKSDFEVEVWSTAGWHTKATICRCLSIREAEEYIESLSRSYATVYICNILIQDLNGNSKCKRSM